MKQLMIDTATTRLSVALSENGTIQAEATVMVSKNHAVTLMPMIEQLMAVVKWTPAELERVIVTTGPGSYTGIRIGVTTAKTLAYTLQIPLVGVSALRLMAAAPNTDLPVVSLIDARRGNAYIGHYQHNEPLTPDAHASVETWLETHMEGAFVVVGDVEPFRDVLANYSYQEAPAAHCYGRASDLVTLGEETSDVHAFEPEYLRLAEAEAKWLEGQNHG
ncbi:tRNA (adenosine(37)-N6)-threonylcarbamoyltransferase complex dimerization subunit type 1 TsaB [Exiguobacterium alkaliphilum]|uniref:tRNA (adenosine(37)-N6)-threonylcarbamoyltransferase complex dimerization subunit type 1 TsaB n=1 Tax=Exiguobacterium alkaliphilum TaxID=1428684 RepID=UPI001BAB69E3|nr:tRNA (adenosine(37)-N6)-threonylcarbamoyltransferase complex dimerization subunit type 1 TsaB [Exiguobacterium alkaliphilum]QUE86370.1 tRNA (adenosine(37)-N6)-threonylcarbamoyltransferase complex dimerization subunit type 1 TsaB [Exiguobacterium alkaliphilum]